MRIYAQRPGRAALQVLTDVGVLAWVGVVAEFARVAQAVVLALQAPARRLSGAGESISGTFDGAARSASRVPLVGDDLARALGTGTGAGESLSASGRELAATAASAASGVGATIAVLGVVPVVAVWLTLRVRWVRATGSARRADVDLLALHALTRRPTERLRRAVADPADAWRRGEPEAVARLAALELRSLGLRSPDDRAAGRAGVASGHAEP
jgi:hypothetical protein